MSRYQKADRTKHFWSLKLFPKGIRDDVSKLYSFVQVVHGLVDQLNPDIVGFEHICKKWKTAKKSLGLGALREGDSVNDVALKNISYIVHRYSIDPVLIDAFLESMKMDLSHKPFDSMNDIQEYMYGSSEVLALMVSKVIGLPEEAYDLAKLQGRTIQHIHFISSMASATKLGRQYFPKDEIALFGLKNLSEKEISRKPAEFREFMQHQVSRYQLWQKDADKVFRFIPKRSRIAVRTAADMYSWSAKKIYEDPMIVFKDRVAPNRLRLTQARILRTLHS